MQIKFNGDEFNEFLDRFADSVLKRENEGVAKRENEGVAKRENEGVARARNEKTRAFEKAFREAVGLAEGAAPGQKPGFYGAPDQVRGIFDLGDVQAIVYALETAIPQVSAGPMPQPDLLTRLKDLRDVFVRAGTMARNGLK